MLLRIEWPSHMLAYSHFEIGYFAALRTMHPFNCCCSTVIVVHGIWMALRPLQVIP